MNRSDEEQVINFEYHRWSVDVSKFSERQPKISWEAFNAGWNIAKDYFSPNNDFPDEALDDSPDVPVETSASFEAFKVANFRGELTNIINKYSRENKSDTPDFILASYIEKALQAFEETVRMRQEWCDHLSPRDSY